MPTSKTILGIDPGYADCGYGVIKKNGSTLTYVTCDTITTPAREPFAKRLLTLHTGLDTAIKKYKPQLIAVEQLFFFKNKKTAIDVAQSRGVVLLLAAQHKIQLVEYTPPEIKQSLTSNGKATKTQVAHMVKQLLNVDSLNGNDDAIDGLAIAICAAFRAKLSL